VVGIERTGRRPQSVVIGMTTERLVVEAASMVIGEIGFSSRAMRA
jgi:hypothetical protein